MSQILSVTSLVALATLTILEVVLGIDNVIFIAIVSGGLPKEQRQRAQRIGLALALLGRIAMVFGLSVLLRFERPLFSAIGHEFSFADVILVVGGLFLIRKATREIFNTTELVDERSSSAKGSSFAGVVAQIVAIDMVFAIDSVLTAIGLTQVLALIVIAMTIAIAVMMFYATPLSDFVHAHPSVKLLALAFLVLIGVMLFLDGFGQHVPRGYVYAAISFSLAVEALNFRRQRNLLRKGKLLPGTEPPSR